MNESAARIVDECIREKKACLNLGGCKLEDRELDDLLCSVSSSRSSLERITALNLRDTGIATMPECVGAFSALQTLDLGNTRLAKLPESIEHLRSLKYLFLDHTYVISLPAGLLRLPALRKVVVYDNIIFPLRRLKKSLKEMEQEMKEMDDDETTPPDPFPPLVDDSVGDMLAMMHEMLQKLRPGSTPRPVPADPEPSHTSPAPVEAPDDTPRHMIVGDMIVGFYVVPNKTKKSSYGGRSLNIFFQIAPGDFQSDRFQASLREEVERLYGQQ